LEVFFKSGNNLHTDMDYFDSQWIEALSVAARAAGEGSSLFLEKREDLAVSFARHRSPAVVHTFWSGMAARRASGPGLLTYRSNPTPDDALRLLKPLPGHEPAVQAQPAEKWPAELSIPLFEDCYAAVERILAGIHPEIALTGRGVAFDQRIMVGRSDRPPAEDRRRGFRLRLECMLDRGDRRSVAVGEAVLHAEPHKNRGRIETVARSLAERAERRLDAKIRPEGEMPVVFAPGVGGVLIHEIVGHALEADAALGEGTWLAELEEQVSSMELLVLDDPRRGRAAWRIDDEAEEARPTALIREGRVAGWLLDCETAGRTGRETTGHGRCSSFREEISPRMGCTFVAPGSLEAKEVIGGVRCGIYVRRMEAGKTDIKTGRALFRVIDSDLIRDGEIDAPLMPHLLRVDGAEALSTADRIADDLQFDTCIGSCHRDGQPLAISVGAPTFWIGHAGLC
jgi:predicted Zn-dependent protease